MLNAAAFKAARKSIGLSQQALASAAGISLRHYQSIELGQQRSCQSRTLSAIRQVFLRYKLPISYDDLFIRPEIQPEAVTA